MRRTEIASIDNLDRLGKLGRCIGRHHPSVPQRDLDLRTAPGCMSHRECHKNRDKHSPAEMLRTRCIQHLRMLRSLASDGAHKSFHTLIDRTGHPDKHYPNRHDTPRVPWTPLAYFALYCHPILYVSRPDPRCSLGLLGQEMAHLRRWDWLHHHSRRHCPAMFRTHVDSCAAVHWCRVPAFLSSRISRSPHRENHAESTSGRSD